MSVNNDADCVAQSIESILRQQEVDFEFIIVNDGSEDNTGDKLSEFRHADDRIKILEQRHQGLTGSLIAGCTLAQGKYIARQDAGGDISLPGRLNDQFSILEQYDEAVMIGSGARFVGPDREFLYDSVVSQNELEIGLQGLSIEQVRGPAHHCSTMLRNSAYRHVGGYRDAFYVAQDLDLWMRLYEAGRILADEAIRYEARIRPTDISCLFRKEQVQITELIVEAARLRRMGRDDAAILNHVEKNRREPLDMSLVGNLKTNYLEAKGLYFIGSCINGTDPRAARKYYRSALGKQPFHLRALMKYISSYLG